MKASLWRLNRPYGSPAAALNEEQAFNQVLEDGIPRCMENNNMPVANVTWEGACAFSATEGVRYPEYVEATADNMVDPSYKADWNPIAERKEEMDGARRSWTDSQQ